MRRRSLQNKGYRKNAAALLLAVAFLFGRWGCCPLPISAAEGNPLASSPEEALLAGLLACESVVDLSAYALPTAELGRLYADLLYETPELFHVALRLSFSSREATVNGVAVRTVAEVYPSYTLTGEALTAARALYRDTVGAILAEMETALGDRPRSEAETVLYIHDLLADRYAYDTRATGANADATRPANADAYSFFRDGVGICQAYALAFIALARGAGLEADFVSSDAMDHAWNHVRVDGVWYHVDVTRDDPIPAAEGREEVNHHRLLRSDEGMAALGYHGYSCTAGHVCTDTRFEPDGAAVLGDFHDPLTVFGSRWAGADEGGAPVAVAVEREGVHVGRAGDMDGDGEVTPADLLAVYDPAYPEAWREWLRERLVNPPEVPAASRAPAVPRAPEDAPCGSA